LLHLKVGLDAADPVAPGRWWATALEWVVVNDDPEEFEIRPAPDARSKLRASSPRSERQRDLEQEIHSFREDVEDLAEPIEEFALFDQCMFTIGVSAYGIDRGDVGYVFGHHRRAALAMDMRGFDKPQYDLLAFPGEEPPQIECNEDAPRGRARTSKRTSEQACPYRGALAPGKPSISELGGARSTPSGMLRKPGLAGLTVPVLPDDPVGLRVDDDHAVVVVVVGEDVAVRQRIASDG
jgi:hypothetical protein